MKTKKRKDENEKKGTPEFSLLKISNFYQDMVFLVVIELEEEKGPKSKFQKPRSKQIEGIIIYLECLIFRFCLRFTQVLLPFIGTMSSIL